MGVDIQTYRARIGTNKFAFGSDVVTSSISVNFSLFLKSTTISLFVIVMCLVVRSGAYEFSLIDAVDVANQKKAEQTLELQLPGIDAVRYIPAILGPLWNCLVLKQRVSGLTGALIFIGLLLLRAGIEPNPGPKPGREMGIDIQTYRARIGTNKAAFGVDVMTSVVKLNFRQMCRLTALLVYLLVMIIVAFVNIQEHANVNSVITEETGNDEIANSGTNGNTVSHLQMIGAVFATILALRFVTMKGAVRFIGLLLLMSGIESNPGPFLPAPEEAAPEEEPWPSIGLTDENIKNISKAIDVHWKELALALCVEYDATTDIKRSTTTEGNHSTMVLIQWNQMSEGNRVLPTLIEKLRYLDNGSNIDWNMLREKVNEMMLSGSGTNHSSLFKVLSLNAQVSVQVCFEDIYSIKVDVIYVDVHTKGHPSDPRVRTIYSPQWADVKCRTKKNIEDFSLQLRKSISTEVMHCSKKSVAFSPFSYGNCPPFLAMVEFTASLLELKRVGTGILKCIFVVSQDDALALDLQLCLESMLNNGSPPGWFDYESFANNKKQQNEQQSVKSTGRSKPEKKTKAGRHIFERLHLTERLDHKISIEEAITIYNSKSESASLKESPWILLQKLMFVNWNEGEGIPNSLRVTTERNTFWDDGDDPVDDENTDISVIDIFMAVFHCTDIMLRPLLFQKMHLCKIALPFVYKHYLNGSLQIARWPLQLLQEHSDDTQVLNTNALNMKTNVITFIRLGRPTFSKSLLLNRIFHKRSNAFHTFFNKDCRGGRLKRYLHEETVEISWLSPKGPDSVARTFLNVRGDFETIYSKSQGKYRLNDLILKLTDVCVVIVDIGHLHSKSKTLLQILDSFPCHLLLLSEHTEFHKRKELKDILASSYNADEKSKEVNSTHERHSEKDVPQLIQEIDTVISRVLKDFGHSKSVEERLNRFCNKWNNSEFEEHGIQLEHGKRMAQDIFNSMMNDLQWIRGQSYRANSKDLFRNCLTELTPVSYVHSKSLYDIYKDLRAPHESEDESERIHNTMIRTRQLQLYSITKTTIVFAKYLVYTNNQPLVQNIFIQCLKVLIDNETSELLSSIIREKNKVYERILLSKNGSETIEKRQLNERFVALDCEISASSLTVDHLLREVSHVYDSIIYLNKSCKQFYIPQTKHIVRSFTNLMVRTWATDIVTEHFFMPKCWTGKLFKALDKKITKKDSITIVSVLGLQSTGKSTLLNTMFGQQFRVRGGRCTKGVQARLVPISDGFGERPSKYIMVFDSEGLRAPELQCAIKKYDRDNELATFVSGLGNVSIMTVNGENSAELTDIIQIVVHSSLRLKTANSRIVLGHKCLFVHNNVEEQSEEQMQKGYVEFRKIMDTVATEAAQSEGLGHISSFNDIMQFEERRPFKALPNIWHGESEIRIFNSKYSKRVAEIKSNITLSLGQDKYKSFGDISEFASVIWDGVISESFVFSFRNNLEIKLYCCIEKEIHEMLWKSQLRLQDEFNKTKRKGEVETDTKMQRTKAELKQSLALYINSLCSEAKEFTIKVLKNCPYPNIAIQWESRYIKYVDFFYEELRRFINQDVDRYFYHIKLEAETASVGKKHRDVLKDASIRIAQTMQGKKQDEYDHEFDKLWNTYENDFCQEREKTLPVLNVRKHFRSIMINNYSSGALLADALSGFERKIAMHSSTSFVVPADGNISKDNYSIDRIHSPFLILQNVQKSIIKPELQEYSGNVVLLLRKSYQTKGLINETDIKWVFEEIVSKSNDVDKRLRNKGVTLKASFVTEIVVQTLQYASYMIDCHNDTYENEYGFSASLKRFRNEMYDLFVSEITQRRLEERAAIQFCRGIENAVTDIIKENLTIRAKQLLLQELPNIKFNLIKTVSCSLLKANCFQDFIKYIKDPRDFCCSWFIHECNEVLHSKRKYMQLLEQEITKHQREIQEAIFQTDVDSSVNVSTWFRRFAEHLTLSTFSEYHFRTFLEIDKLEDFKCFFSFLMDKTRGGLLSETFERIENSLRNVDARQNTFTVLYESIFDICWGCSEVCPFCQEPCMKSKDHKEKHQCLQHRPTGGKGTRWVTSKEMVLSTCNFLVNSMERRYLCSVIGNKCCCEKPLTENDEGHLYREYREFFNDWEIMPSSDPHGCCKHWLWFVGKYAEDLERHYEYKISEIPDSWGQISDEDAQKSLDTYFTVI
ncbi:interferon-induced very large GTPase 1-like isoform X2 [Mya arenaria]|nr:interferon-induced very large GTPase 1-like isoform X2 [Mya arenaria]